MITQILAKQEWTCIPFEKVSKFTHKIRCKLFMDEWIVNPFVGVNGFSYSLFLSSYLDGERFIYGLFVTLGFYSLFLLFFFCCFCKNSKKNFISKIF